MPYYIRVPRHEEHQHQHVSLAAPPSASAAYSQPPPPTVEEDPDLDDEGLSKSGYDVVICGTGLVQSILASALARAGKSVLHCDGNDYYGETDAVLNLDHMATEWAQKYAKVGADTNKREPSVNGSSIVAESHDAGGDDQAQNENINDQLLLSDQEVIIDLDPAGGCAGLVVHSCTSLSDGNGARAECDLLRVGAEVITDLGEGRIIELPTESRPQLTVSLANDKLSTTVVESPPNNDEGSKDTDENKNEEKSQSTPEMSDPVAHFGFTCTDNDKKFDDQQAITAYYQSNHNIWAKSAKLREDILHKWGRSFALDLTPGLIYATGDAVNGLIKSGVADYLEFKSAEAIYLLMEPSGSGRSGRKQSRGGTRGSAVARSARIRPKKGDNEANDEDASTVSSDLQLSRVPCSKGDVFQTKLLSPVEKRRLMKFLQLASDYAISVEAAKVEGGEKAVSSNGEESTADENSGDDRQVPASDEGREADNIQSLNERQLLQGRSLTRPQNKVVSTSDLDTLRDYIDREVNFDEYLQTVHNLPERLKMIVIHAMAMESAAGSATTKADVSGCYPTGRAMADLCRHLLSLGRYGSTAFLFPMYGSGELSQSFCRSAAVHGATYLLRRPARGLVSTSCKDREGMVVSGIVLGGDVDPSGKSIPEKIIRAKRVVVPSESLTVGAMADFASSRRIVRRVSILSNKLIVDNDTDDISASEQRHIIVVPPNTGKIGNECVIHGIALDDSVSIAPRSAACTVLHLTTSCHGSKAEEDKCHVALEKVAQSLIDEKKNQEMYHCSFSFASHDGLSSETKFKPSFEGLTYCHKGGQSITLEAAFHQAGEVFDDICPNADFLALSKEMDEMVRERVGDRGDDSDDEQMVLESAMDLIDSSTKTASSELG